MERTATVTAKLWITYRQLFLTQTMSATLSEDASVGASYFSITGTDEDGKDGAITFDISGNDKFEVNAITGAVTLKPHWTTRQRHQNLQYFN